MFVWIVQLFLVCFHVRRHQDGWIDTILRMLCINKIVPIFSKKMEIMKKS